MDIGRAWWATGLRATEKTERKPRGVGRSVLVGARASIRGLGRRGLHALHMELGKNMECGAPALASPGFSFTW